MEKLFISLFSFVVLYIKYYDTTKCQASQSLSPASPSRIYTLCVCLCVQNEDVQVVNHEGYPQVQILGQGPGKDRGISIRPSGEISFMITATSF